MAGGDIARGRSAAEVPQRTEWNFRHDADKGSRGIVMALTRDEWLRRYRARILYHQPDLGCEVLDDYVTTDTYEAMRVDFPDDPELAVDIDPDLAYADQVPVKKSLSVAQSRRRSEVSQQED